MNAPPRTRTWGARFSITDGIAIALCLVATLYTWPTLGQLALFFPVALGHFFLFCNIFRVRRSYELIWTAAFLTNVFVCLHPDVALWSPLLITAIQSPITLIVLLLEMRSPRYHGVAARFLNPRLDDYLSGEVP